MATAWQIKVSQALAYIQQHGHAQAARHAADQAGDQITSAQWLEAEERHDSSSIGAMTRRECKAAGLQPGPGNL